MALNIGIDELDICNLQPFQPQRVFKPANGLGAGKINLDILPVGQAKAAALEVFDMGDAAFGCSQNKLCLIRP